MRVDQDVGDRIVLEQRLDRPKPQHLVGRVAGQLVEFARVQRHVRVADELAHDRSDLVEDLVLGRGFQRGRD